MEGAGGAVWGARDEAPADPPRCVQCSQETARQRPSTQSSAPSKQQRRLTGLSSTMSMCSDSTCPVRGCSQARNAADVASSSSRGRRKVSWVHSEGASVASRQARHTAEACTLQSRGGVGGEQWRPDGGGGGGGGGAVPPGAPGIASSLRSPLLQRQVAQHSEQHVACSGGEGRGPGLLRAGAPLRLALSCRHIVHTSVSTGRTHKGAAEPRRKETVGEAARGALACSTMCNHTSSVVDNAAGAGGPRHWPPARLRRRGAQNGEAAHHRCPPVAFLPSCPC